MVPDEENKGLDMVVEFECPECGAILSDGVAACPACGTEFDWEEGGFDCGTCGAAIEDGMEKCPSCGAVMIWDEPVESAEGETPEAEEETLDILEEEVEILDEGPAEAIDVEALPGQVLAGEEIEPLTNSMGMVNGTGMTHGVGMTNGQGLTNGHGLTNGDSMHKDKGFVNGTGMTNGDALTKAEGFVNGRGLTNGEAPSEEPFTPMDEDYPGRGPDAARMRGHPRRRWAPIYAAVMVAVLILVSTLLILTQPVDEENIVVDGKFGDWDDVTTYTDGLGGQGSPDIDIKEWAVDASGDEFSVFVKVAGRMLTGAGGGVDSFQVFVDSDMSTATGYAANGVGAEHLIEVTGWDGDVHTASMRSWQDHPRQDDMAGFESGGRVQASSSKASLELQVGTASLWMKDDGTRVRVLVRATDGEGAEDWSDTAVNQFGRSLEARQSQVGKDTRLVLNAHNGEVTLRSLDVHYLGEGAEGRASMVWQEGKVDGGAGAVSTLVFDPPLKLAAGAERVVDIENELLAGTAVLPIVSSGDDLVVDGKVETYVSPLTNWTAVLVEPVAGLDVRIDGNFEDWYAIGAASTDPAGDVVAKGGGEGAVNPGVDIRGFDTLLTPLDVAPTHVSVYLRVNGQMLGGMLVEGRTRPGPPGPPGPAGPPVEPPDQVYMEDRTSVYIDTDPGASLTGYRVAPGVGAEFRLEVTGKSGRLLPGGASLSEYSTGTGTWRVVTDTGVDVGLDKDELEMQVDMDLLPGLVADGSFKTYFVSTDWTGASDDAMAESRSDGEHLTVWETVVDQDQKVWPGDTDVPVLRLVVENTASVTARLTVLRAGHFGTLGTSHIPAVKVWLAEGEPEAFDPGTASVAAEGREWTGDVMSVPLGDMAPLGPGQRMTLFVTVDIAGEAPTLEWFDIIVVHDMGLEATLPIHSEAEHSPYRFIRVWRESDGRTLPNHIVINEIRSDGSWKWCELYNPTASGVNVLDWYAKMEHDSEENITLLTYEDKTMASDSLYAEILDSGVNMGGEEDWWVTLYEDDDSIVDSIPMPSSWVSAGNSWARYKDANGDPYYSAVNASGDWYDSSSPSQESANDQTIPEFEEVMLPVLATLVFVMVFRRRSVGKRGRD